MSAIRLKDLSFRYSKNSRDVIKISKFVVSRGERLFLFGPSGSGKTSLLSLIAGLFQPTEGSIDVLDYAISTLSSRERDKIRARDIGFIFQAFNLIPYLSVVNNVTIPCRFGRKTSPGFVNPEAEALYLLSKLGLGHVGDQSPGSLSVGQQQRVAAARALIGSPGIIIADEPTSALDTDARSDFLRVLFDQASLEGSTVLFVSHDRSLASLFDRSISLSAINDVVSRTVS